MLLIQSIEGRGFKMMKEAKEMINTLNCDYYFYIPDWELLWLLFLYTRVRTIACLY